MDDETRWIITNYFWSKDIDILTMRRTGYENHISLVTDEIIEKTKYEELGILTKEELESMGITTMFVTNNSYVMDTLRIEPYVRNYIRKERIKNILE